MPWNAGNSADILEKEMPLHYYNIVLISIGTRFIEDNQEDFQIFQHEILFDSIHFLRTDNNGF